MLSKNIHDVAIVGGGPAGCAAAIQLKRSKIEPIVFEKEEIGGLVWNANFIENYLGIPFGVKGTEFARLLRNHLKFLKIEVQKEEIVTVKWGKKKELFQIASYENEFLCKYLILATGTEPKKLAIVGENQLIEKEILFYEPKNIPSRSLSRAHIAIIGGGDVAFDYALNLSRKNNHVNIFHRGKKSNCLPLLYQRAKDSKYIVIRPNKNVRQLGIPDMQQSSRKALLEFADGTSYMADLVLVAIGRKPNSIINTKLFQVPIDKEYLFLIGDLVNSNFRQLSISAGDGIKTAMKILSKINKI